MQNDVLCHQLYQKGYKILVMPNSVEADLHYFDLEGGCRVLCLFFPSYQHTSNLHSSYKPGSNSTVLDYSYHSHGIRVQGNMIRIG